MPKRKLWGPSNFLMGYQWEMYNSWKQTEISGLDRKQKQSIKQTKYILELFKTIYSIHPGIKKPAIF